MKGNRLAYTIAMLVAVTIFTPLVAQAPCIPPVEVSKSLYCFSDKPPYYVGNKYYFWIQVTVTANTELSDVVVFDRYGAELMIEGISMDTPKHDPYDYKFTYNPYAWDGEVRINGVLEGKLNKDGVSFADFDIFWTGNSVKVHFQWNIGAMSSGTTKTIYVTVSTDTNPAGKQEYTSCGWYELNSGATVKAIVVATGKQVSAESETISIFVNR